MDQGIRDLVLCGTKSRNPRPPVFYFQFNIWNSVILEIGSVLVQIPRYCCSFSSETFNRLKKKKKKRRKSIVAYLDGLSLSASIIETRSGERCRAHFPRLSCPPPFSSFSFFYPVYQTWNIYSANFQRVCGSSPTRRRTCSKSNY